MKVGFSFILNNIYSLTSEGTNLLGPARVLMRQGHDVFFIHKKNKVVDPSLLSKNFNKEYRDVIPYIVDRNDPRISLVDFLFSMFDYKSAKLKWAHTKINTGIFVFALTPLPEQFTRDISKLKDIFFVVGNNTYKEVIDFGIDAHLFTGGNDTSIFNSDGITRTSTTKFLWVGGNGAASSPDLVLQAYLKAFDDKDDVCLTMVCPRRFSVRGIAKTIKPNIESTLPKVVFTDNSYLPSEMAAFYKSHDATVMPIRFHGECIPVREAMACGSLVITTPWTGPLDYANENEALFLDFDFEYVKEAGKMLKEKYGRSILDINKYCDIYEENSKFIWAKPSIIHLAELMRGVYENKHDKEIVNRAIEKSKTFTWEIVTDKIMKVVREYDK